MTNHDDGNHVKVCEECRHTWDTPFNQCKHCGNRTYDYVDVRDVPIEELIERSSFGTPRAKAIRARTPKKVVDELIARMREKR